MLLLQQKKIQYLIQHPIFVVEQIIQLKIWLFKKKKST